MNGVYNWMDIPWKKILIRLFIASFFLAPVFFIFGLSAYGIAISGIIHGFWGLRTVQRTTPHGLATRVKCKIFAVLFIAGAVIMLLFLFLTAVLYIM